MGGGEVVMEWDDSTLWNWLQPVSILFGFYEKLYEHLKNNCIIDVICVLKNKNVIQISYWNNKKKIFTVYNKKYTIQMSDKNET